MSSLRSISIGTGKATFLRAGPSWRKPVVLLHGGGIDRATLSWGRLLPELAREYLVVAPNWPGYAGTTPFAQPYRIEDLGEWLMEFLDAVGVERAALVGVSMGGGGALWSAIHHRDRVEAIVLVGTYGIACRAPYHLLSYLLTKAPLNAVAYAVMRRSRWALRKALGAIYADGRRVEDTIVEEARQALLDSGGGEAFTLFQRGEMTPDGLRTVLTAHLPSVLQPTLFVHGRADPLVPKETVKMAASRMPNARLEIMDAGHWPMRERPDAFNAAVVQFLRDTYAD